MIAFASAVPLWSLVVTGLSTPVVLLAIVRLVGWIVRNNAKAAERREDAEIENDATRERESTARHRINAESRARADRALERQLDFANERMKEKDAVIAAQAQALAAKDYEISLLSQQNGGLTERAAGHEECLAQVREQAKELSALRTSVAVAKIDSEHKDDLIAWLENRLAALEPVGSIPPPRPKKRSITPADMPAVSKEQPK